MEYWITDWANLRCDEVIRPPETFIVHPDFALEADEERTRAAYARMNGLFLAIYGDIARRPAEYGMPMHDKGKYRFFSQQWRDAGTAPYRPFELLRLLLSGVEVSSKGIVKNARDLYKRLSEFGFGFDPLGLPDDPDMLELMRRMAVKATATGRANDFAVCHFRLLQDAAGKADYGSGADDVADRLHTPAGREFVYAMDEALMARGMFRKPYGGYECHGLAYYNRESVMKAKGPYLFRMVSRSPNIVGSLEQPEKLQLLLRIRNVGRCMEYLKCCPEKVKDIFRRSDAGCQNRPCNMGVAYTFEGESYWRCGCCAPAFRFTPVIGDIPHYIRLVELGAAK